MNRPSKSILSVLAIVTVIGAGTGLTYDNAKAHGGATGVVKERMMLMEGIGKAMKGLVGMIKGHQPFDANEVARLSAVIVESAGENLTRLFPAGSLDKPTEALPIIWEQWNRFETAARDMADKAQALNTISAADQARVAKTVSELANTCRACHGTFREKKR